MALHVERGRNAFRYWCTYISRSVSGELFTYDIRARARTRCCGSSSVAVMVYAMRCCQYPTVSPDGGVVFPVDMDACCWSARTNAKRLGMRERWSAALARGRRGLMCRGIDTVSVQELPRVS